MSHRFVAHRSTICTRCHAYSEDPGTNTVDTASTRQIQHIHPMHGFSRDLYLLYTRAGGHTRWHCPDFFSAVMCKISESTHHNVAQCSRIFGHSRIRLQGPTDSKVGDQQRGEAGVQAPAGAPPPAYGVLVGGTEGDEPPPEYSTTVSIT